MFPVKSTHGVTSYHGGAQGDIFQRDVTAYVLTWARKYTKAFTIGSEVKDTYPFDDIVLWTKAGDGSISCNLIQCKHFKYPIQKPISANQLDSSDEDFKLSKYFRGYMKLKNTEYFQHLDSIYIVTNNIFDLKSLSQAGYSYTLQSGYYRDCDRGSVYELSEFFLPYNSETTFLELRSFPPELNNRLLISESESAQLAQAIYSKMYTANRDSKPKLKETDLLKKYKAPLLQYVLPTEDAEPPTLNENFINQIFATSPDTRTSFEKAFAALVIKNCKPLPIHYGTRSQTVSVSPEDRLRNMAINVPQNWYDVVKKPRKLTTLHWHDTRKQPTQLPAFGLQAEDLLIFFNEFMRFLQDRLAETNPSIQDPIEIPMSDPCFSDCLKCLQCKESLAGHVFVKHENENLFMFSRTFLIGKRHSPLMDSIRNDLILQFGLNALKKLTFKIENFVSYFEHELYLPCEFDDDTVEPATQSDIDGFLKKLVLVSGVPSRREIRPLVKQQMEDDEGLDYLLTMVQDWIAECTPDLQKPWVTAENFEGMFIPKPKQAQVKNPSYPFKNIKSEFEGHNRPSQNPYFNNTIVPNDGRFLNGQIQPYQHWNYSYGQSFGNSVPSTLSRGWGIPAPNPNHATRLMFDAYGMPYWVVFVSPDLYHPYPYA